MTVAAYANGVTTTNSYNDQRGWLTNVVTAKGTHKSQLVCTQCIRSGGVKKIVRAAPFKVPQQAAKA